MSNTVLPASSLLTLEAEERERGAIAVDEAPVIVLGEDHVGQRVDQSAQEVALAIERDSIGDLARQRIVQRVQNGAYGQREQHIDQREIDGDDDPAAGAAVPARNRHLRRRVAETADCEQRQRAQ